MSRRRGPVGVRAQDALLVVAAFAAVSAALGAVTGPGQHARVDPAFGAAWASGGTALGGPVSEAYPVAGATAQDFQHGMMFRGAEGDVITLTDAELHGLHPRSAAVAYALDQQGEPYRFGADGPDAWDCSSLVQRAYHFAGAEVPRRSEDQAAALPPAGTPEEGDLLAWPGHVGLYAGTRDGRPVMVTATSHRYGGAWRSGVLLVDPTTRDGGSYIVHRHP